MFEDPNTPTFLGLSAPEWHAAGYGLMEGCFFWKRRVTPYDQIDALPLSPEWKADLKAKYHYYRTAFELPETAAIAAVVVWLLATHGPAGMDLASKFFFGGIL